MQCQISLEKRHAEMVPIKNLNTISTDVQQDDFWLSIKDRIEVALKCHWMLPVWTLICLVDICSVEAVEVIKEATVRQPCPCHFTVYRTAASLPLVMWRSCSKFAFIECEFQLPKFVEFECECECRLIKVDILSLIMHTLVDVREWMWQYVVCLLSLIHIWRCRRRG